MPTRSHSFDRFPTDTACARSARRLRSDNQGANHAYHTTLQLDAGLRIGWSRCERLLWLLGDQQRHAPGFGGRSDELSRDNGSEHWLRVVESGSGGCLFPAFSLPSDNPNPRGATPAAALALFLASGSVFGAVPPILNPVTAGYPASGWVMKVSTASYMSFKSGADQLDFSRVGAGSWVITGGQKNC